MTPSRDLLSPSSIFGRMWFCCVMLAALNAACYIGVYRLGFSIVDDHLYVYDNPKVVAGLTWESVRWAFTTFEAEFWHPMTWLSLMLDASLYGMWAGGFHLTNLWLHTASCLLLFAAFDTFTSKRFEAFVMTALFAVHPLHIEAVAWVAERKEVLCGFFWSAALLAYAHYAKNRSSALYVSTVALFFCGIMAKPMIVTFPCCLLLLDYWPLARYRRKIKLRFIPFAAKKPFVALFLEKIPFFAMSAGAVFLAIHAQKAGGGIVDLETISLGKRLANAVVSYKDYLVKAYLPLDLSVFYPFPTGFSTPEIVVSLAVLGAISVAVSAYIVKKPYLFVGWCWFLGTLTPVIGIVKIGDFAMADRYMYMPIAGILFASVWLIRDVCERFRATGVFFALVSAVLILSAMAANRNYLLQWKSDETLFRHAAQVTAPNFFAQSALGDLAAKKGRLKIAEKRFRAAASMRPDKTKLLVRLGRAVGAQGRFEEALVHFEKALEARPDSAEARYYVALALAGTGKYPAALDRLSEALKMISENPNARGPVAGAELAAKIAEARRRGDFHKAFALLGIDISRRSLIDSLAKAYEKWTLPSP